jgi:hypothetical protein
MASKTGVVRVHGWQATRVTLVSVKATVCEQWHAGYVWTASDMAIVCEQWQGRSLRTVSDTATPCEQWQAIVRVRGQTHVGQR